MSPFTMSFVEARLSLFSYVSYIFCKHEANHHQIKSHKKRDTVQKLFQSHGLS